MNTDVPMHFGLTSDILCRRLKHEIEQRGKSIKFFEEQVQNMNGKPKERIEGTIKNLKKEVYSRAVQLETAELGRKIAWN